MTVASSDSGGGAGVQADLKAFAAAGCFGTSVVVGLTAQNTVGIRDTLAVPPAFVTAQLEAIAGDIGVDAAKTGALLTHSTIEVVCEFFEAHPMPLVVDPVLAASSGASLLAAGAVDTLIARLIPLAAVVTPNEREAAALAGVSGSAKELAERIVARGARAVVITGGQGDPVCDHFFDGTQHVEIAQECVDSGATHGSGCTHSATLAAELAKGASLLDAARTAARVTAGAIAAGLDLGKGPGPVDVLHGVTR